MSTYLELYIKAPDGTGRVTRTERDDAQGRVRIDKAAFAELARGARYASVTPVDRIAQTGRRSYR